MKARKTVLNAIIAGLFAGGISVAMAADGVTGEVSGTTPGMAGARDATGTPNANIGGTAAQSNQNVQDGSLDTRSNASNSAIRGNVSGTTPGMAGARDSTGTPGSSIGGTAAQNQQSPSLNNTTTADTAGTARGEVTGTTPGMAGARDAAGTPGSNIGGTAAQNRNSGATTDSADLSGRSTNAVTRDQSGTTPGMAGATDATGTPNSNIGGTNDRAQTKKATTKKAKKKKSTDTTSGANVSRDASGTTPGMAGARDATGTPGSNVGGTR